MIPYLLHTRIKHSKSEKFRIKVEMSDRVKSSG